MPILNLFASPIYHNQISDEFLLYLQEVARQCEDGESVGYDLAGNIDSQKHAVVDPKKFTDEIYLHVIEYLNVESVSFNLGTGPWINYMKRHEFNPLHTHDGMLSAVIFIDVPEEIEKEKTEWEGRTNCFSAGALEFVHAKSFMNNGHAKVIPKTGDMYIFPADMPHTVYPFSSDVTRISMSFNVFNLQFN